MYISSMNFSFYFGTQTFPDKRFFIIERVISMWCIVLNRSLLFLQQKERCIRVIIEYIEMLMFENVFILKKEMYTIL